MSALAPTTRTVLIHVFDECRKTAKDFVCRRDVLLEKMKYFRAYLNQSNELDGIDISVHCDVEIFEWLVEYMHQHNSEWKPHITLENIAPILVSSEFLQMDTLVEECIAFISRRLQEFLHLRVDFGCLSDRTVAKIAEQCDADDLQKLKDPKDKVVSKLFRKKLESLLQDLQQRSMPLSSCANCEMIYLSRDERCLQCPRGTRTLSVHGELLAIHQPKSSWIPEEWASRLVQHPGMSWCAIYWLIWASTQCFHCSSCRQYCSFLEFRECAFHPGPVVSVGAEAKFGCCDTVLFFGGEFDSVGCRTREHTPIPSTTTSAQRSVEVVKKHWDLISTTKGLIVCPGLERRMSKMDLSVVLASGSREPAVESDPVASKALPASADIASPRRFKQWQTLRLQEQDHARMQSLTKRLTQLWKPSMG